MRDWTDLHQLPRIPCYALHPGLGSFRAVQIRLSDREARCKDWMRLTNSVNLRKHVVVRLPFGGLLPCTAPRISSWGALCRPCGTPPSYLYLTRHFRAGLLLVSSLRDWLRSYCLILLDGRAIVFIAGYIRHLADREILIWTNLRFIRPLRDWTPRLLKLVLLSTRARRRGGCFSCLLCGT
jgi:hypothetical protein